MIADWSQILAQAVRQWTRASEIDVYSDVNPSREWAGKMTLEFSVRDVKQVTFLSGDFRRTVYMSAAVRAETEGRAEQVMNYIRSFALRRALEKLVGDGLIGSWAYEELATSPDVRGLTSGESFYGYVDFYIVENPERN